MLENVFWANCITSTNDLIKKYPPNSVFIAAIQTQGRGQYGRSWLSEKGGLYFTYKKNSKDFHSSLRSGLCAIAVGVALHKALKNEDNKLYLKWPNDLLNQRFEKIAGILIELSQENYLIGIGLNCDANSPYANYKSKYANLWLAKLIIEQIDLISEEPADNIIEYWEKHTQNQKGFELAITLPNKSQIIGKVSHLGKQGELWIETKSGKLIAVQSGSINKPESQ